MTLYFLFILYPVLVSTSGIVYGNILADWIPNRGPTEKNDWGGDGLKVRMRFIEGIRVYTSNKR